MSAGQENFKNLFNAIHDFVFILDLNGNIIEINQAVNKFLGYREEDLKGKSVLLVHPFEYRNEAMRIVGEMISGTAESCPLPLLTKKGSYIPVETRVYPGKWNDEQVLFGISRNLSEITISEEKFHRIFDNSQAMMAISEIDSGKFIDVNNVFLKNMGYVRDEIIGRNSKELNIFFDYEKRNELAEKLKNSSVLENENVIIRTKDGRAINCLFSLSYIKIQTYSYILTSAIDISQLKDTEKKLKKNLTQQTFLADISQHFLSLDNFDQKIEQMLEKLGNHTGASRVYIFADNPEGSHTSNTHEWCKSGIEAQISKLQHVPYSIIPSWKKLMNRDGKIVTSDIGSLPPDIAKGLADQNIKSILCLPLHVQNRLYGYIGFDECETEKVWEQEDIEMLRTIAGILSNSFERQAFQKQLRESEIRLKLAIDNTEAGLWDWDIQTGKLYLNDVWYKMIGYEKDEIVPHVSSWENLLHPDDKAEVLNDLNKHLNGECESYQSVHRFKTKSGLWKWLSDKGKVIEYDNNHKPLRAIGTHIDIDNQKKVEEELRNLNNTKDKLFSIIAHDLKGPIGTMMHISEMVSEKGELDEETLYGFLNSQKELTINTYQLLENLLNWASFNSQKIQFNPATIDLNQIIDETITGIRFKARQKGISIVTDYSASLHAFADEEMVRIIFRNLMSNAVKFTEEKGFIRIELEDKLPFVEIKITDTGKGISSENIAKILSENEFYSTRGTANENGTGLGLKLCKSFITQNKGEFGIESTPGRGTCFIFTLPAVKK